VQRRGVSCKTQQHGPVVSGPLSRKALPQAKSKATISSQFGT
jgi:hypothetical protein